MGRILYKDIELEEANKKVHFPTANSRNGTLTRIDGKPFSIDKNSLSHA